MPYRPQCSHLHSSMTKPIPFPTPQTPTHWAAETPGLVVLGLNHRSAPVDVRERVAFATEQLPNALAALRQQPGVREALILSTCNRSELYCVQDHADPAALLHWWSQWCRLPVGELRSSCYQQQQQAAVRHLFRVACSLDSLVLGEPQILGQLKTAYQAALDTASTGPLLDRLLPHAFRVAKRVRTDTAIGASAVSVAFAAVSLARRIFADLRQRTALLLGAGEMIELAARHLHEQQLGRLIIANRTVERAHTLAARFHGYAITLEEVNAHLAEADIIIASTASQVPLLYRDQVAKALKARRYRPLFLVDIAVPRNIDPAVGELADAYLYTVDDLHQVIEENLRSRQEAARQAEEIIEASIEEFTRWQRTLDAVQAIRQYREQAGQLRDETLHKAQLLLARGKPPQEVLQFLAHTLTNKLTHAPSANLRQAAAEGRADFLRAARELLNLPPST